MSEKTIPTNQPIRICHIIGNWVGGGVEAIVMNYYRNIDRSKIQFDFICSDISTDIPCEEIKALGGRIFIVPHYHQIKKYNRALREIFTKNNYTIVHSHLNALSVFPLRIAKKCGIPVRIAHSHSTTSKREFKKDFVKNALRPFSKLYATDYFCCSEYAGRWLFGNRAYNQGKVYLLKNAIDLKKFKPSEKTRAEMRDSLGIGKNTLVVGHSGRFVAQKNHTFLIDIFYELHKFVPDSKLVLVGQGDLLQKMKAKVRELNLKNNVMFLGQRNDVEKVYQAFDVFVMPSIYEGLGVVGIEMQYEGIPCVFSDVITDEVQINPKITVFKSLKSSAREWAKATRRIAGHIDAKPFLHTFQRAGFDISLESKKLEAKYVGLFLPNSQNSHLTTKTSEITPPLNVTKVCHFSSGLKMGGVERVILNYTAAISSAHPNEYEWHLLYQHPPVKLNEDEFKKLGFHLLELPSKTRHPIKNYRTTKKYLKENHIDIVHAHMTLMNFFPLLAAKKLGIKTRISHAHGTSQDKSKIFNGPLEALFKYLVRKNATVLLACGEDAGKYLYGNQKFQILENAIDIKKFAFDPSVREKKRRELNLSQTDFIIGHIGRFEAQKNHKFLIDTFSTFSKKHNDSKLLLVGDGELKPEIAAEVKSRKLQDKVIFLGTTTDIKDLYSVFDVFVLPSLWEGLPVSVVEAQANGLTCLLSETVDQTAKILPDKVHFLPLETEKWANKLSNLYETSQKNNSLKSQHAQKLQAPSAPQNNRTIDPTYFTKKHLDIDTEQNILEKIYHTQR